LNEEEVKKILERHPEYADLIQYVRPEKTGRRGGYWRVKPYTYFDPHPNQIKPRIALAEVSYENFGSKGFDYSTGKPIPIVAMKVKKRLKGKKFKKPTLEETIKKLEELSIIIAKSYKKRIPKAMVT
jgi:hypothetical protein